MQNLQQLAHGREAVSTFTWEAGECLRPLPLFLGLALRPAAAGMSVRLSGAAGCGEYHSEGHTALPVPEGWAVATEGPVPPRRHLDTR